MKQIIFKQHILATCKSLLVQRIATAQQAMNAAQEAANGEDKSSAGDKYETGRAMGQLDRNMNAKQLALAQIELADIHKLEKNPPKNDVVYAGSLLTTSVGFLYIAVGLGKQLIEKENVILLSKKSPLAMALLGKKKNDSILFNSNTIEIFEIV